jgi:hypothetical protein
MLALAIALALLLAFPATASNGIDCDPEVQDAPGGGIEGGPAILAGCGDLYIRNIQGTAPPGELHNLDLGGGSTQDPGDVVVNYDVGRCLRVFDGHKRIVMSVCPRRVVFHRTVRFRRGISGLRRPSTSRVP